MLLQRYCPDAPGQIGREEWLAWKRAEAKRGKDCMMCDCFIIMYLIATLVKINFVTLKINFNCCNFLT